MTTIRIIDLELPCKDHGRTRSLAPEGYALVSYQGRTQAMHRLTWAASTGVTIGDLKGVVVRHKCDNPRCIEPTHLESGSRADNNRDRAERGRSAKRVPSRQSLTDAQVLAIRGRYVRYSRQHGSPALAREYGVDPSYIHRIITGEER